MPTGPRSECQTRRPWGLGHAGGHGGADLLKDGPLMINEPTHDSLQEGEVELGRVG